MLTQRNLQAPTTSRLGIERAAFGLLLVSVFCTPWAIYSPSLIPGVPGLNVVKLSAILAALIVLFVWLAGRLVAPMDAADGFALAFAFWATFSLLWADSSGLPFQVAAWAVVCSLMFVSTRHLARNSRDIGFVATSFLMGSAFTAVVLVASSAGGAQDGFTRGTALGLNPNYVSYTLVTAVGVAVLYCTRKRKKLTATLLALITLFVLAVFLTGTRGSLIALVAMLVFMLVPLGLTRIAAIVVVVAFLCASFAFLVALVPFDILTSLDHASSRATGDLSGRLEIWPLAQQLASENWFRGVGIGTFPSFNPWGVGVHNVALGITVELGVVGFVLYCGWIVAQARLVVSHHPVSQARSFGIVLAAWIPIALSGEWSGSPVPFIVFAMVCPVVSARRRESDTPPGHLRERSL